MDIAEGTNDFNIAIGYKYQGADKCFDCLEVQHGNLVTMHEVENPEEIINDVLNTYDDNISLQESASLYTKGDINICECEANMLTGKDVGEALPGYEVCRECSSDARVAEQGLHTSLSRTFDDLQGTKFMEKCSTPEVGDGQVEFNGFYNQKATVGVHFNPASSRTRTMLQLEIRMVA